MSSKAQARSDAPVAFAGTASRTRDERPGGARNLPFQPKTAFPRFPSVRKADPGGQQRVKASGFTLDEIDHIVLGEVGEAIENGPVAPDAGGIAVVRIPIADNVGRGENWATSDPSC